MDHQLGRCAAVTATWLAIGCVRRLPLGDDLTSSSEGGGNPSPLESGAPCYPCSDFPSDPIIVTGSDGGRPGAPTNAPDLFVVEAGSSAGGPCLVEPEDDSLFPQNWLRPRFRLLTADPTKTYLFEIRVHAQSEANDLLVYTTSDTWTMPIDMWTNVAAHAVDEAISVSIRSGEFRDGQITPPVQGPPSTFRVAPTSAPGSIVYWTTTHGSALKAFRIGDQSVVKVLTPNQVNGQCLGCHSSTPDGQYVAFTVTDDPINGEPARIDLRSVDGLAAVPPFVSNAASTLLARTRQDTPTFSPAHWSQGDHILLTVLNGEIIWTDLEASTSDAGSGVLLRSGNQRRPAGLAWSHDGSRIVYVSSSAPWETATLDGDLVAIPFAEGKGGTAVPIQGASDPAFNEYYPAFSHDDRLLAFNRVPVGMQSDKNPDEELFILPSLGGAATRLKANDPPACEGKMSPGLSNGVARWAPAASKVGDKTYYWLTFSSTRAGVDHAQIYLTSVVLDRGDITTHGSLYFWNQPLDEANISPSWSDR
jgi:hypothetical protein